MVLIYRDGTDVQLEPGQMVGKYRVEALVGEGGMARVYRVRHLQLDALRALKVLTSPSAEITRRLLQEGRIQARLRHRNVVNVTDTVQVDGAPGLVMDFVRGPSLAELIQKRRLTLEQVDMLALGILAGVEAAHSHGLVHRDLKPANVMLAIEPQGLVPKVADFGLSKILGGDSVHSTKAGIAMGTPAYMAPEQITDASSADARADVFSLGAILYEMLTGERCFDGGTVLEVFGRVAAGSFVPLDERMPDLPAFLCEAVHGALRLDRDDRVQRVAHLAALWSGERSLSDGDAAPAASRGPFDGTFLDELALMTTAPVEQPITAAPASAGVAAIEATTDFDAVAVANATLLPAELSKVAHAQVTPPAVNTSVARPSELADRRGAALGLTLLWVMGVSVLLLGGACFVGIVLWQRSTPERVEVPPHVDVPVAVKPVVPVGAVPVDDTREHPDPLEASVEAPAVAPAPVAGADEPDVPAPTAPEPSPSAPEAAVGTIVVSGDYNRVYVSKEGSHDLIRPGVLEPGTYFLRPKWTDEIAWDAQVEIVAGETVRVNCSARLKVCRTEP